MSGVTIITGQNHSYSVSDLLDVNGGVIMRQFPQDSDSFDVLNFTGTALLNATIGANSSVSNEGYSFQVTIQNQTDWVI